MAVIGRVLTTDGSPAQVQLDEIRREFPEAGGTRGFIVFHAEEGDALTLEDRATIARAVWSTEGHDGVVDKSACLAAQQQFDAIGQRLGDLQGGSDSRGDRCLST